MKVSGGNVVGACPGSVAVRRYTVGVIALAVHLPVASSVTCDGVHTREVDAG